jgi:hypothetical protein
MSSQFAFPEILLPFLEIVIVNVVWPAHAVLGIVPVHVPLQGEGQKSSEDEVVVPHWFVATSLKEENAFGVRPVMFAWMF